MMHVSIPSRYVLENLLTEINDKLRNLKTGNPFLPPDADTPCALEVVPVHDYMNQQVQSDRDPRHSSQANQLGVAEQSRGTMVIGVEEGQGLLLEEEEDGVDKLDVLVDVVQLQQELVPGFPRWSWFCYRESTYVVKQNERLSPASPVVANRVKHAVSPQSGKKLLNEQNK